jgi:hypothetical protein
MRVSEEPVCINLFREKPVFTSLHLKSPVHVVPPLYSRAVFIFNEPAYTQASTCGYAERWRKSDREIAKEEEDNHPIELIELLWGFANIATIAAATCSCCHTKLCTLSTCL